MILMLNYEQLRKLIEFGVDTYKGQGMNPDNEELKITRNMLVTYSYKLLDEEGNILDESGQSPREYVHGYQHILPSIEKALSLKKVNDEVRITLSPKVAFGEIEQHLIHVVPKNRFENADQLKIGMQCYHPDNKGFLMRIIRTDEQNVTLDANHPLAGKSVVFVIKILQIRAATQEELKSLHKSSDTT